MKNLKSGLETLQGLKREDPSVEKQDETPALNPCPAGVFPRGLWNDFPLATVVQSSQEYPLASDNVNKVRVLSLSHTESDLVAQLVSPLSH